jgi:hypothetical protein
LTAIEYSAQSKLDFDIDQYAAMGIRRVYATPFDPTTDQRYAPPEVIQKNLEILVQKAKAAADRGIEVYPMLLTIHHPEGNFTLPDRYRKQQDLDGAVREGFVCFRDATRQDELVETARHVAELGFERIAFDDDLRDAFCYCDQHLKGFDGFEGKTRDQISRILNAVVEEPEQEQLRIDWYHYKYQGMAEFARRLREAVHTINPACRIGIFTSAKRCQDFSGRSLWPWARLFHTEQAPTFVRLAGECYTDDTEAVVRCGGWQQTTRDAFPEDLEQLLEVTATLRIGYRSPGTVGFETKILVANTGITNIHWAWADEFEEMGLAQEVTQLKGELGKLAEQVSAPSRAPLALLIGEELGPYTPTSISVPYGATHDPMSLYGSVALLGLPVTCSWQPEPTQPAILCSAYISRKMIRQVDQYVSGGGVAMLDAIAARCYQAYGGKARFAIEGPHASCAYELGPDGTRETMISRCPPDCIYRVESANPHAAWRGYQWDDTAVGHTSAVLTHGQGKLIVLGYDLSRTGTMLVVDAWRQRLLAMLAAADVSAPTYWSGPAGVQVIDAGDRVALVNYNTNRVTGDLKTPGNSRAAITIPSREIVFVAVPS